MVYFPMLFACHYLQIACPIIALISIAVMHHFIGTKRSTNFPTSNITMHSHITVTSRFGTARLVNLLVSFIGDV